MYIVFSTKLSMYFSYSNSFNVVPLQLGTHDYIDLRGTIRIEVIPVRTIFQGLCYKLKLSKPLPFNPDYFIIFVYFLAVGNENYLLNFQISRSDLETLAL